MGELPCLRTTTSCLRLVREVRIRDGIYSGNFGRVIGWYDGELDVFLGGGPDWPVRINAAEAEPVEKSEPRAVRLAIRIVGVD